MLQSRRVIDITNTLCNYLFLIFLFLFGIYASSLWTELDETFISYLVNINNIIGISVIVISLGLFICAIVLLIADKKLKVSLTVFSLLRIVFSAVILFAMDALTTLVSSGFEVKL